MLFDHPVYIKSKTCQLLNSKQGLPYVLCGTQYSWDRIRMLWLVITNNFF
jgi:hypothetical protein